MTPPPTPNQPDATVTEEFDGYATKVVSDSVITPEVVSDPLVPAFPDGAAAEEEHHEALIGKEYSTEAIANKNPTLAISGENPFGEDEDGNEAPTFHKIVSTEVVAEPLNFDEPEPILQNAIVLVDPRVADCEQMLDSAKRRGLFVTAIIPKPNNGSQHLMYNPTAEKLLEIGVHMVYEPPLGAKFDVIECANHLQTVEAQQNLRFLGVLPFREAAVDTADVLCALLGIVVHNDLGLSSARRDKGLMKLAVANAGLRVAKYARLTASDGSDVEQALKDLELEFPVVVKTPRGMSTMDVYICDNLEEAIKRSGQIVRSVGPDGRKAQFTLMEEFLQGDEFAVNVLASPTTPRGVQVTDVWKYDKIQTDGTMVDTWQTMVDPHNKRYASLVRYAEGIARACGIKYGMGHVEIKAIYDEKADKYIDPVMIEVGARLAGGRKAIMAQSTIPGWYPFDAMLDAHCGFPVRVPHSFTPAKVARHVFVPSDKEGIIKSIKGDDFKRLGTYDSCQMLKGVGEHVVRARDLLSFAGFVWLIGDMEGVERDSLLAREEFVVEVEDNSEEEKKA